MKPAETKLKRVSEQGLLYFKSIYAEKDEPIKQQNDDVINSLLEQLKQKDIQLSEKDKQISMLMEQAKNYQVLLQGQQMLSLKAPKKSFIKRLFSRSSEQE